MASKSPTQIEKIFLVSSAPGYFRRSSLIFWYLSNLFADKVLSYRDYADDATHKLLFIVANGGNVYERSNILDSPFPKEPITEGESEERAAVTAPVVHKFIVSESTRAICMSKTYRVVISIDCSPSMGQLDLKTGKVVFSHVFPALKKILLSLVEPILLNLSSGEGMKLNPEVYISVIAQNGIQTPNGPLGTPWTKTVLIQGLLLTCDNVNAVLDVLEEKLASLERGACRAYRNHATHGTRLCSDLQTIIQHAWLSLILLPIDSCSRIIHITDGVSVLKDYGSYDNIIMRLNREEIEVSIVQLRAFSPHCGFGYVPDTDLQRLLAHKTGGMYLTKELLETIGSSCCSGNVKRNVLQQRFFFHEFSLNPSNSALCSIHDKILFDPCKSSKIMLQDDVSIYIQSHFTSVQTFPWLETSPPPLGIVKRKQMEYQLDVGFYRILDVRLNEGFEIIHSPNAPSGVLPITFVLDWEPQIRIIYEVITTTAAIREGGRTQSIKVVLYLEAYLELLEQWQLFQQKIPQFGTGSHFMTEFSAQEKSTNFLLCKLHLFLISLKDVDNHLRSFASLCKNLSDKPKERLDSVEKERSSALIGKVLKSIKDKGWYRWFKIYRVEVALVEPGESENVASTSPSTREAKWKTVIRDWCSFELISVPNTFVMVFARKGLTSFPTFCLLHVHFNTPSLVELRFHFHCCTANQRYEAIQELMEALKEIGGKNLSDHLTTTTHPTEMPIPFYYDTKPLFQLVIQYNEQHNGTGRMEDDNTLHNQNTLAIQQKPKNILSRYMFYKRVIWEIDNEATMKTMIEMVVQLRLKEGFFRVSNKNSNTHSFVARVPLQKGRHQIACTFQYLLFQYPPNLLVTEFWMEPQFGCATGADLSDSPPERIFEQFVNAIESVDKGIIISMWTFYRLKHTDFSSSFRTSNRMNITPFMEETIVPYLCIKSVLSGAISTLQTYDLFQEDVPHCIMEESSSNPLSVSNEILATMLEDELHFNSDCEIDTGSSVEWHTLIVKETRQRCRCFVKDIVAGFILAIVPMVNQVVPSPTTTSEDSIDFSEDLSHKFVVKFYECSRQQVLENSLQTSFSMAELTKAEESAGTMRNVPTSPIDKEDIITDDTTPFSAATKQYYSSLRFVYGRSFAKGIYTNIKEQTPFSINDFQKAIDYCREFPCEIDLTQYFRIQNKSSRDNSEVNQFSAMLESYLSKSFSLIEGTRYYYYSRSFIERNANTIDRESGDLLLPYIELDEEEHQLREDHNVMHSKSQMGVYPYPFFLSVECQSGGDVATANSISEIFQATLNSIDENVFEQNKIKVTLRITRYTLDENGSSTAMMDVMHRLKNAIEDLVAKEILIASMGIIPITEPIMTLVTHLLAQETQYIAIPKKHQFSFPLYLLDNCFDEVKLIDELEAFYDPPLRRVNQLLFYVSHNEVVEEATSDHSYTIPYWLILRRTNDGIGVFFFNPCSLEAEIDSHILSHVISTLKEFRKRTNQLILLQQLHESHHCSDLLVPNDSAPSAPYQMKEKHGVVSLLPGHYRCELLHSIVLTLHSRVSGNLAYAEFINSSLNSFKVHNRRGLFVYQDQEEKVFYMKLKLAKENDNKSHAKLILEIYGLDPPGNEITLQLRQSLEDKLASITVNVLSEILARNPKLKLTPEDIHFLYTTGSVCMEEYSFPLPPLISASTYLFLVHLMQMLSHCLIHCNVTSNTLDTVIASVLESNEHPTGLQVGSLNFKFIYNYTQTVHSSLSSEVGTGLCFIRVYLYHTHTNEIVDVLPPFSMGGTSTDQSEWVALCDSLLQENGTYPLQPDANYTLVFRCWNHSVAPLRMESLHEQLQLIVKKTIIEHAVEQSLFTSDIEDPQNFNMKTLQLGFHYALSIGSCGVAQTDFTMNNLPSWSLISFLSELMYILQQLLPCAEPLLFYSHSSAPEIYHPISSLTDFQQEHPLEAHTKTQYAFSIFFGTIHTHPDRVPSVLKLYNPSPLADPVATSNASVSSEVSKESLIPRKWLASIKLTVTNLSLSSYNWNSGVLEEIQDSLTRLLNWNDIRMHLLLCITHQKLGLLRHIPRTIKPPLSYAVSGNVHGSGHSRLAPASSPSSNQQAFLFELNNNIDLLLNCKFPARAKSNVKSTQIYSNGIKGHEELLKYSPGFENVYRDNVASIPLGKAANDHDFVTAHVHQFAASAIDVCKQRKMTYLRRKFLHAIDHQTASKSASVAHSGAAVSPADLLRLLSSSIFIHACRTPFILLNLALRSREEKANSVDASNIPNLSASSFLLASQTSEVFSNFLHVYSIYLESLDVFPIQVASKQFFVFQKQISGGILIIEISLRDTIVCINLYAIRNDVHQTKSEMRPSVRFHSTHKSCPEKDFYEEATQFRRKLHMHSFLYDYQLYLSSSSVPLRSQRGSLIVSLFNAISKKYPIIPPGYSRNLLRKKEWKYAFDGNAEDFVSFISKNAATFSVGSAVSADFELIRTVGSSKKEGYVATGRPVHSPEDKALSQISGLPNQAGMKEDDALRFQWTEIMSFNDLAKGKAKKGANRNEEIIVAVTVTTMNVTASGILFGYFVSIVHPNKFLRENEKLLRENINQKRKQFVEDMLQKAQTRLEPVVKNLQRCFVGGLIWERLLADASLLISEQEKHDLFFAADTYNICDYDSSLSRLSEVHVPVDILIESLEKVHPSRVRTLPSTRGKQENLIIRDKQMIHIINDIEQNSMEIFVCLRKPVCLTEEDLLRSNAIEHCSRLISHICYILWFTMLEDCKK